MAENLTVKQQQAEAGRQTGKMPENKMGTMPVNRLLISMSFPMMVSMLVQALYNVVDSIFVAQINENALTAVSLAFPVQSLMIAAGVGTGVGVNAVLSRSLGEKNHKKANQAAENGVFLALVCYVLFLAVGLFGVRPFFMTQTRDAQILEYGTTYLTICCVSSIGMFVQMMFERLLQSTGRTVYTMFTQGTGAIINIILDPILIFGLFGMPAMGVAGAAAATVSGQIVAGILAIILNRKKNHDIQLSVKGFVPSGRVIADIYKVGVPSMVMQAIGSVMVYGMNLILIGFSSTATAVFGVYFKLQSFIFMPVFGLNNGMVPIIAYNFGAGKRDRVVRTSKLSMVYAVSIMLVGLLVLELIPDKLLLLFDASEHMLSMGVVALRIICISFAFAGFCIVCSSVFQALGNGIYSMFVSIARQLLVLLPVAWLLSRLGNVDFVWWAFPIAELVSFTLTIIFMIRINKNVIRKIPQEENFEREQAV